MEQTTTPTNLPAADFFKFEIKTGRVLTVEAVPKSKKLLKLSVSFGPLGERTIMAGIGGNSPYGKLVNGVWEDSCLVGTSIVAVLNLEPREMMGVMSHGMLLASHDADGKIYLIGCGGVPEGSSVG